MFRRVTVPLTNHHFGYVKLLGCTFATATGLASQPYIYIYVGLLEI